MSKLQMDKVTRGAFSNLAHENDSNDSAETSVNMWNEECNFTQSYCTTWNVTHKSKEFEELQCICQSVFSYTLIVELQKQHWFKNQCITILSSSFLKRFWMN